MYLRSTKRKNKNGSTVEYFQLAHNERHPETRKPVAKIIHNFGRADQLDREELIRLCRSIAKVYLPSCQDLKLKHMYEAMDFLHEHSSEIEEAIFFKVADLFNLEVDLIFYDTTTASFHVDYEDSPDRHENATLRKFGHAKEGFWAPQVVIALAVQCLLSTPA